MCIMCIYIIYNSIHLGEIYIRIIYYVYVKVDYEKKPVLMNCSEKLQLTAQTEKRFAKEFLSRRTTTINLRLMHTNTHTLTNAHRHAHHCKCTP